MRPNSLCPIFVAALVVLPCAADAALSAERNTVWNQDSTGIIGDGEAFDRFGASLVTGDFNGDEFDDFAAGAPGEEVGGILSAGAVNVFYGSASGITASGDQYFTQGGPGSLGDVLEPADALGSALAVGDFDRDGFDDLAVGVPLEDEGGAENSGIVQVIYGSAGGLDPSRVQQLGQTALSVVLNEAGDAFGAALAAGDFDGDGYDDLAIGALGEDVGSVVDSGGVAVVFGGMGGLDPSRAQAITQNDGSDAAEDSDYFGSELSAGDYNGDGFDDLAASAPFEDLGPVADAGAVDVFYGSADGLFAEGHQFITRESALAGSADNKSVRFGSTLASGFLLDGDRFQELAIGTPSDSLIVGEPSAGTVLVQRGTASGLVPDTPLVFFGAGTRHGTALVIGNFSGDVSDIQEIVVGAPGANGDAGQVSLFLGPVNQIWDQDSPGIAGVREPEDFFGFSLATGDFDNDGTGDLLIGAPGEALGNRDRAGTVNLIYGSDVFFRSGFEAGEL